MTLDIQGDLYRKVDRLKFDFLNNGWTVYGSFTVYLYMNLLLCVWKIKRFATFKAVLYTRIKRISSGTEAYETTH